MKTFKSLLSVVLVFLLMLTFTGCFHKQNEIAVEVGDVKFTSAMYSYVLLNADTEARTKVDEQLAEAGTDTATQAVDYYAQKIDDIDFVTWVENRAIEMLSEYAAYETFFKEAGLTLDDESKSNIESYAEYYFPYYQEIYEANGVSIETYSKMLAYDVYADKHFTYLYGKDGSRAIAQEDISKAFSESYRKVLILQTDITQMEEADVTKTKADFEHYKEHLKDGESVVEVYNEFNGLTEETAQNGTGTPAKEEKEVVSVIADPEFDSSYGVEFWADAKDIAVNDAAILEAEENGSKYLRLVYVVDVEDDTAYLEEMDASIRWALKSDEYTKEAVDYAKGMTVVKHKYALSAFKVKDIYYGE